MRTIKFDLNEQAEKLLSDLVKSPAYFGDTPRTLFIKLMMQAGQASHSASKSASNEPETPHIGKVELRQQAEREASLASRRAGLEAQVDTDPPPIPEDYDNLDEYEFARTAWYKRSFPALEEE